MEPKRTFLKDNSKKLLNKIILASSYTQKEIIRINEKYSYNHLFIKQVPIDKYGRELPSTNSNTNSEDSFSIDDSQFYKNNKNGNFIMKKKRKMRKAAKNLNDFFSRYFGGGGNKEDFYSTSEIDNDYFYSRSNNKKRKKNSSNNKSIKKSSNNNGYSGTERKKKEREIENKKQCPPEQLMKYSKELNDVFIDCQSVKCKEGNIENEQFKEKIIRYIEHFHSLIKEEDYQNLVKKWRDKYSLSKNVDPSRVSEAYDFRNWKISLLKGLKSEMVVKAGAYLFKQVSGIGEDGDLSSENYSNNGIRGGINKNRKRQSSSSDSEENESSDNDNESDNEDNNDNDNNKKKNIKETRIDNNIMKLERDRNQDSENDLDE